MTAGDGGHPLPTVGPASHSGHPWEQSPGTRAPLWATVTATRILKSQSHKQSEKITRDFFLFVFSKKNNYYTNNISWQEKYKFSNKKKKEQIIIPGTPSSSHLWLLGGYPSRPSVCRHTYAYFTEMESHSTYCSVACFFSFKSI